MYKHRIVVSSEQAAKDLEAAVLEVLDMAQSVERDPTQYRVKDLCAAVREWRAAGQALHDAQVAEARAS
jgi:hypothetical protein